MDRFLQRQPKPEAGTVSEGASAAESERKDDSKPSPAATQSAPAQQVPGAQASEPASSSSPTAPPLQSGSKLSGGNPAQSSLASLSRSGSSKSSASSASASSSSSSKAAPGKSLSAIMRDRQQASAQLQTLQKELQKLTRQETAIRKRADDYERKHLEKEEALRKQLQALQKPSKKRSTQPFPAPDAMVPLLQRAADFAQTQQRQQQQQQQQQTKPAGKPEAAAQSAPQSEGSAAPATPPTGAKTKARPSRPAPRDLAEALRLPHACVGDVLQAWDFLRRFIRRGFLDASPKACAEGMVDCHEDVQVDDPATLAARPADGTATVGVRSSGRSRMAVAGSNDASATAGTLPGSNSLEVSSSATSGSGSALQSDRADKAEKMQASGLTLDLGNLELEELSIALRRPEFRCARVLNRLHTALLRVVLEDVEGSLEDRAKSGKHGHGSHGGGHGSLMLEAAEGVTGASASLRAPKLAMLSPLTWPHLLGQMLEDGLGDDWEEFQDLATPGVRAAIRRLNKADYAALSIAERVAILKYLVDCVTATINFSEMMDDVDVQRQEAVKEHASEEERYLARIKKQKQEAKEASAERVEKLQEQLKLALEELGEDDDSMAPKPKAKASSAKGSNTSKAAASGKKPKKEGESTASKQAKLPVASSGQAAMEDGEQAGSGGTKAGGADKDEVLEVEDSSGEEDEGEGDDEEEDDDSDLDSVGSFNSQASEFKEMGSAAVRQKRLEHDRHRKARIEEKRRQKRLAKAAETIETKRTELIAEMKGAAAAKDIDRLRQAITRAQDSACEFVIGRGKGKRRSPSLLRAMIEEQRLEETLEISAINERAEENRLRKLRRHFRRLEPHRTQALCLGRDGLRRTYWYYTHDRTAIYVEQPVFDSAAQEVAVKEAARRAAHKAASAGGIASVSGATPLRPVLASTGAAGAVASDRSGSSSSGAAAMLDGDEGEAQASSAPAAAAPLETAVPTVLVGGTWDRLDDKLRIAAEERLAEDAVIAQAAIAQRQPKLETVVWGRIETFEAVQQLLDSLDRRGEDEDDLFRQIEAWSQVLSSSIPTAEELEEEDEAGPQTDDEAMEDDEGEDEEGAGSKGGRGVGAKEVEEEEMDGAVAIAIKRSMRGNKAPRGTVESDDEGEAELELDSFKYGGGGVGSGSIDSASARPSREEREEMKEKQRLEELERARNGGKTRKRGRVKYSAFIPRKRRRTESDAAVEQRTPGKLFSAFRNQRRTTLRRRLDLGHGAGSGSDGDSDEDEDGSDSEVEEMLNESLFEGGGGVEGVGNKDHPYDELSAPAGNLCSLRSTLLRMEEQLRDALHAAKAPWYVKAGQSTGGSSGAGAASSSSSSSASSSSSSLMKLSVAGPIDLSALPPPRGAWVTDVRTATSPHQLSKAALLLEAQAYHPQRARRLARLAASAGERTKGEGEDEEAGGKAAAEDDPATGWSDGEQEDEEEQEQSKGSAKGAASEGGQAAMESGEEEEEEEEGSRNGEEDEDEEDEEEADLTQGAVWTLRSLRRRWRSAARRAVTVHSIAVLLLELQERAAVAGLCPAPTSLVVRATRKAALKKEREEAARRRREAQNKKKSGKGASGSSRGGSASRGAATAGFEEAFGSRRSLRERTKRVSYSDMGGGGGDSDDEDYHRGSRRGRRGVIDSDEEDEDEEAERAKAELMGLRRSGRAAASNARRNIRRS